MEKVQWNSIDKKHNGLKYSKNDKSSTLPRTLSINHCLMFYTLSINHCLMFYTLSINHCLMFYTFFKYLSKLLKNVSIPEHDRRKTKGVKNIRNKLGITNACDERSLVLCVSGITLACHLYPAILWLCTGHSCLYTHTTNRFYRRNNKISVKTFSSRTIILNKL